MEVMPAADLRYANELLALLDDRSRHDVLKELSVRVLHELVKRAASEGRVKTLILPTVDADGNDDWDGYADEYLEQIRPPHEAHDYLDDHWNFIWEDAWPEGLADAILGSCHFDGYSAAELMEQVKRLAEDIVLPEDPPFGTKELRDFIQEWRGRFLASLQKLRAE